MYFEQIMEYKQFHFYYVTDIKSTNEWITTKKWCVSKIIKN